MSSRRGTSSHADEDDEDAAALGVEDDDGIDDAKLMISTLRLSCYKSCHRAALHMHWQWRVDGLSTFVYGLRSTAFDKREVEH